MQLFANESLGARPHIAVLGSNKLGNFVVTTPLLRGLKAKYPGCILDFFGSDRTAEFERQLATIDWRMALHTSTPETPQTLIAAIDRRRQQVGPYDLVINCDDDSDRTQAIIPYLQPTYLVGSPTPLGADPRLNVSQHRVQAIRQDPNWNSPTFVQTHVPLVQSNYIAEIFCRLAYVETNFTQLDLPTQIPPFAVPDVLIHVTASRAAKLWPREYWQQLIQWCQQQALTVGLVGSAPAVQKQHYHASDTEDWLLATTALIDLRGQATLPELAGALAQTRAFVTVDTGPLHVAAAVGCPTVAIFGNDSEGDGASPMRLWAPRQPHVTLALSQVKCTHCQAQQFKNTHCVLSEHRCMMAVFPETVMTSLQHCLSLTEGYNSP
ncbi:MAG: glycosyltransferase family 9 protein [Leptolyngbya sp. SIOISBB]|nr:glycosyltransferase family 9 protein [Leptolyngbya sp. SIOISBB]